MYKLLVTTALVAITATSASAWEDAKSVITKLHDTYNYLDGGTQFDVLQGETGELNTFVNTVNQGVTYLSLTVDNNNDITATINEGVSLNEITDSANDLVNRVNFDLFVEDANSATAEHVTFTDGHDYTGQQEIVFTPVENSVPATVTQSYANAGLLGKKIDKLVTGVETINNTLIGTETDQASIDARNAFIDEWNGVDKDGNPVAVTVNTGITTIKDHITNLNLATDIVGGTAGDGFLSEGLDGITFDAGTVNQFNVPGIQADGQVVISGGTTYTSLYNWATDKPVTP